MASTSTALNAPKLTASCSRCRASKLKCDKNEPCMECIKREVGHLCTKDERQPRAKRAKTDHVGNGNTKTSQKWDNDAEEAVHVLENFVNGSSSTNPYAPSTSEPLSSTVASDQLNIYWSTANDPYREGEALALIRRIVDALPEMDLIRLLYQVFTTRCQGPLGNIVHTPTFMQQFESFAACLNHASPENRVMAIFKTLPLDTVAVYLLALVLALDFHPTPNVHGWSTTPLTLRIEELRSSNVHSRTWRSLAIHCLRGPVSLFCGSVASLQAGVMLLLDGHVEPSSLDAILVTAISGAHNLGLHKLGNARLQTPDDDVPTSMEMSVRIEVGIRIWWALVMRDWSRGQALGHYSIHPSQSDTRMPLHINDADLPAAPNTHVRERPRSEFTMLSYTVHALEIAILARKAIDLRTSLDRAPRRQQSQRGAEAQTLLNGTYQDFVAALPSHFRLGSTAGSNAIGFLAAIPVHRWMLHQQLWSLFLRLHRATFLAQDGRATCHLLAQNIISTQAQIQARCSVAGSLSTCQSYLFNAAIVLLVDLIFSTKSKDADRPVSDLGRLMTRDMIGETLELLRARSGAETSFFSQNSRVARLEASNRRSVTVLEALMRLEEAGFGIERRGNGMNTSETRQEGQVIKSHKMAGAQLKTKVMEVLANLEGNDNSADAQVENINPTWTAFDGFQDLGVLPVLSNDPERDLWQFLDFAPPSRSATENDLGVPVGSTPYGLTPDPASSSRSFYTPEFASDFGFSEGGRLEKPLRPSANFPGMELDAWPSSDLPGRSWV